MKRIVLGAILILASTSASAQTRVPSPPTAAVPRTYVITTPTQCQNASLFGWTQGCRETYVLPRAYRVFLGGMECDLTEVLDAAKDWDANERWWGWVPGYKISTRLHKAVAACQ